MGEQHIIRHDPPPSFPSAPPPPVPVVEAGVQTGTLMLTRVAEGYEARCYKFPPNLKPGVMATIPLADWEPEWAALYDRAGNFVRVITN